MARARAAAARLAPRVAGSCGFAVALGTVAFIALAAALVPFFTPRDPVTGAGLSLSISRRIVEQHGARITVDSATKFRVVLPMHPPPAELAA